MGTQQIHQQLTNFTLLPWDWFVPSVLLVLNEMQHHSTLDRSNSASNLFNNEEHVWFVIYKDRQVRNTLKEKELYIYI